MKFKKIAALAAGCAAIFLALVVVDELAPEPVPVNASEPPLPVVSVVQVTPQAHQGRLQLLATTSARWPMQLKVSSSGQLAWLDPNLEPGTLVKQGAPLARLNPQALKANLAEALSGVKQAELNLQQAQHEQTVALKMLSPNQRSDFAKRKPQVAAAKAELSRAQQSYASAEKILAEATISAPFDAVIMARHISPGEWLEAGQVTFEIAASDSLNVALPVSEMHWQQVQNALTKPKLTVVSRDGTAWPAKVRYLSPQADPHTRQRQVVLAVNDPYSGALPLLPNQPVQVQVTLGEQANIASVPASALTRDGYVWTLDTDNRLQQEWVSVHGQDQSKGNGQVHLRFIQHPEQPRQVVRYPLVSMLAGKQVAPLADGLLFAKEGSKSAAPSDRASLIMAKQESK
ncbi:efflux RND transporter periplasmic adaptor subunit [Motilimonas eburnea]|uniref:efflux RND transporter periplasmic adaptor subunit n=1 Tax=Motilimonas eburnea TaxID=1737488 RepID=UPI001E343DA4|nr:efflux RND transporter periplasmic adaptor subunit [Motilimonas eburnea]MCE2571253.1 efflux RND transporter periplasmic adaptor subunit [Motilimonas eburnea]